MKTFGQFKPYETRGRFYVEWQSDGEWLVIDAHSSKVVGFDTKAQALDAACFCRAYVKRHGDIDLASFPYSIDDPLQYEPDDVLDPLPWKMAVPIKNAQYN